MQHRVLTTSSDHTVAGQKASARTGGRREQAQRKAHTAIEASKSVFSPQGRHQGKVNRIKLGFVVSLSSGWLDSKVQGQAYKPRQKGRISNSEKASCHSDTMKP